VIWGRALAFSALFSAVLGTQVPQQPTFRASTDAVLVHVLVRQGSRSIADLTCDEFELRDNDVAQSLDSCSHDAMPLDITVVGDTSQSVAGPVLTRIRRTAGEAAALALPVDRVRRMGFASAVQNLRAEQDLEIPVAMDHGHTALGDAIASALMLPADPGRRRIALVVTDGLDTNSAIPKELVQGIVDRADTVLHVFAIAASRPAWMSVIYSSGQTDYFWFLRDLVQRGGGTFSDVTPDVDLRPRLESAVADVRTRYLLRYSPVGVAAQGWHSISVQVKRPGRYSVTARKGYQGVPKFDAIPSAHAR